MSKNLTYSSHKGASKELIGVLIASLILLLEFFALRYVQYAYILLLNAVLIVGTFALYQFKSSKSNHLAITNQQAVKLASRKTLLFVIYGSAAWIGIIIAVLGGGLMLIDAISAEMADKPQIDIIKAGIILAVLLLELMLYGATKWVTRKLGSTEVWRA